MNPAKLDAVDLRILAVIQKEGRITKLALADRVGLSATPCWMRLKRLEKAGVVAGYHARIDWRQVAPFTTVLVEITLGHHRQANFDHFERAVRETPEVLACWATGGGIDYILKVAVRNIEAYQRLLEAWLAREIGIARYFTYIVTKTVKEEPEAAPVIAAARV